MLNTTTATPAQDKSAARKEFDREFRSWTPEQQDRAIAFLAKVVGHAMQEVEAARRERRAPAWAAHQLQQRRN